MRASPRITWLLLLLTTTTGVLFPSICAAQDSDTTTNAPVNATTAVVPTPKPSPTATKAEVSTTVTPTVRQTSKQTEAPTTTVTPPSTTVITPTAPTKSDTIPSTTPKQPTTTPTDDPTKQQAASTTVSGASTTLPSQNTTVPAASTQSKTPDATTMSTGSNTGSNSNSSSSNSSSSNSSSSSSGGGLPVSTAAPKTQTSDTPTVDPKGKVAPATTQGAQGNVETTKKSTDAAPSGIPTTTNTNPTTSSWTSQQSGKGGINKMTVTVTSQQPTTLRPTQPPVNTGTTLSTPTKSGGISGTRTEATASLTTINTITTAHVNTFQYSLNAGQEEDEKKELVEVCKQLMVNLQDGNCTLTFRHHNGKVQFDCVVINGRVKTSLASEIYEEITKKQTDNKTLIAILASCGALLIMIVILAVCASHHRKPYHENQQHLTEELHTVENGYHDNPTLEVMEVQPEMQEKKMALNGEFNDSWIVPIDNLLKEDIPDEEDTHL